MRGNVVLFLAKASWTASFRSTQLIRAHYRAGYRFVAKVQLLDYQAAISAWLVVRSILKSLKIWHKNK